MADTPLFFLIAGEASGDLLGAKLMQAMKARANGQVRFAGIGGPRMQAEGIDLFFPQAELAHFGLFELLRHVPHLLKRMRETVAEVRRRNPSALITIDAPDFCFRVAKKLKGEGIPLIHYVAPTVWAWRPGRARKIAQFLDHLLALLPFEPPYFTREGLDCTFVGHPIVESGADKGDAERFRAKYALTDDTPLLAVLPGSRMSEAQRLIPIFRTAVERLLIQHPNLRIAIPAAPNLANYIREQIQSWPAPVLVAENDQDKYDIFAASRAALACSGTVAIELAMARLPAVIAYKISPLTVLLYRRFIKAKYASLVNIMHDRLVTPEYLLEDCTPDKLAAAVHELLSNEAVRQKQIVGLADVAGWLGQGQFVPSERAAQTVLDIVAPTIKREKRGMTVLQVIPSLNAGGVERGTVEVVAALTAAGHQAVVASSGGPMAREVEKAGGVHVTLPVDSKNPLVMRGNVRRLMDVIRKYKIDIVHARSRAPAWSARAAARQTGRHFVTTFHNAYDHRSWFKRQYNSIMARGERVIAISKFVGDHATKVYGVDKWHLRVIPRGVDIGLFDPASVDPGRISALRNEWKLPPGAPVIMLPGRLTRWKGHLVLIDALEQIGRRDVVCVFVGGGSSPFRQEVEKAAADKGVGFILRIFDTCRDMPAAYMLADIVVSPAIRPEGFGRVITEAQAMGRPVIATDHGGARETVIPGETGWLVWPGDAAALMRAIEAVLALTRAEKETLAARARVHIRENFTTSMMTTRTLAVYDELINGKSSS